VKIVHAWLSELVDIPDDPRRVAAEIELRGFEVAQIEEHPAGVIDFEITANRPDCLSHIGLAREASVVWGGPLRTPRNGIVPPAGALPRLDVVVEDEDLCPRYCAQVFEVTVGASPGWLAERLELAGLRPINNIVDVTNYVMLELGQPTHAFDLEKLAGARLVVRRARPGEMLRTLDGVNRALSSEMLIIADGERACAIGGVMGGAESEISGATRLMALESAYFLPASIRRTSRTLGLKTEASTRFERGGDINAPPYGIARTAALLDHIGAGRPLGPIMDRYPAPRGPVQIRLRAERISRVLGQEIPAAEVTRILQPLGFAIADAHGAERVWLVSVPSFRVDVAREADLIEEVGRHYGFDRLPVTFPALTAPQPAPDPRIVHDRLVRQVLTACGFSESLTFAFIERQAALPFCTPGVEPAAIANPLSEKFAVLRPSLVPGLVDACAHNRRRERKDVRLFETGSRFTQDGEGRAAAFAWCGAADAPHWSAPTRAVDFFDAKGVVEQLAAAFGVEPEFAPVDRSFLLRGRSAELRAGRDGSVHSLGVLGQVVPAIAEARGLPLGESIYVAEIDLTTLAALAAGDDLKAASLPRFPSIVRDISILVDEALPAAAVRGTIRSSAPPTLVSIIEFDRYAGAGVPESRVSLSLRLTFRAPERTLTDAEVQEATERIVAALRTAHGAEQR
jgi:phenylalanyl-tRNA synthetase beta chain